MYLVDPAAARIRRIGDEIAAVEMPHLGPVRVHAVDDVRGRRDERPEPLLRGRDDIPCANQRRDVLEIADDAEASVGQLNAVDPPFVVLDERRDRSGTRRARARVRLAGLERVAEDAHDFVGVVFVHRRWMTSSKSRPTRSGMSPNTGARRVDLGDAEVLVDQVDAERRLVEQLSTCAMRSRAASRACARFQLRFDARQQLAAP